MCSGGAIRLVELKGTQCMGSTEECTLPKESAMKRLQWFIMLVAFLLVAALGSAQPAFADNPLPCPDDPNNSNGVTCDGLCTVPSGKSCTACTPGKQCAAPTGSCQCATASTVVCQGTTPVCPV